MLGLYAVGNAEADHWAGDGSIDKRPCASNNNGRIKATVNHAGILSFYKDGGLILREYFRAYDGTLSRESRCLKIINREWKGVIGGSEYALNVKFEANKGEKFFGMGQYQQDCLDLKGCVLELAQRNSQVSVPFAVSSLGYGFLWNNPAVGRVTFGKNYTEWIGRPTREMDCWTTDISDFMTGDVNNPDFQQLLIRGISLLSALRCCVCTATGGLTTFRCFLLWHCPFFDASKKRTLFAKAEIIAALLAPVV